jgi:hypothetical protein
MGKNKKGFWYVDCGWFIHTYAKVEIFWSNFKEIIYFSWNFTPFFPLPAISSIILHPF